MEKSNSQINQDMSLAEFRQLYYGNLTVDSYQQCIPDYFADICSGWTQEILDK